MEGALLRVRTLTDVEGSPVSTPGPSPRAVARAPRPRPGKGGVEGEGGVPLWPGGVAAEVAEVVVRFVIMNVMTGGCMVLSAAIYFKLLMLLIQFVFAVM